MSDRTFRRHHWLALVPALALLASPYVANRIEPRIFGMPFLLGWIVVWVVLTSATMALILLIDGRENENNADDL